MNLYIFLEKEDVPYGNDRNNYSTIPVITSEIILVEEHTPAAIEQLSRHLFGELVDCMISFERNEDGKVMKTFAEFYRDKGKESESHVKFQMIEKGLTYGIKYSFIENLAE